MAESWLCNPVMSVRFWQKPQQVSRTIFHLERLTLLTPNGNPTSEADTYNKLKDGW